MQRNTAVPSAPYVLALRLSGGTGDYTDELPALRDVERVELHPRVTFLVGENGSGKSTLVEALAVALKLNPEGGGRLLRFATRASHSQLHRRVHLERAPLPPHTMFFLRAESVFNLATAIEEGGPIGERENVYERPLHEQSHGESFLDIAMNRLGPRGLYLFDEPEAALSVRGQLALLRRIHELVLEESQFIVATHSPILLGYALAGTIAGEAGDARPTDLAPSAPRAAILELGDDGIRAIAFDEAPQVELTRAFLDDPQRFLRHLLSDD
jgi:predicted ATPase